MSVVCPGDPSQNMTPCNERLPSSGDTEPLNLSKSGKLITGNWSYRYGASRLTRVR